jgi:hypothetical protein
MKVLLMKQVMRSLLGGYILANVISTIVEDRDQRSIMVREVIRQWLGQKRARHCRSGVGGFSARVVRCAIESGGWPDIEDRTGIVVVVVRL